MKALISAMVAPAAGNARPVWPIAFVVAVIGTFLFFMPLMAALQPGYTNWPGFMLAHDQRVFYFPSFVEGYRRFWNGGMLGIDFLTGGGAGVFSFRPNLLPFYPPYLLAYLLVDCSDMWKAMMAFLVINVLHAFAAIFFTVVFVRRYLGLPFGTAILAAALFALSHQAGVYIVFATFYFQMMLIPVAACTLCWLMRRRSAIAAMIASPVFVTFALTNYGPTMLVSMGLSIVAALLAFYVWPDHDRPRRWRDLLAPALSVAIAVLATFPYFYGQLQYKGLMAPTADDLVQVAYSLALGGYDLVNALSKHINFKRAISEGTLVWDVIPVFLGAIGLHVLLSRQEAPLTRLAKVSCYALAIYFVTLVVSLGTSSISASTAFYHFAPVIGKMHIFQRYLIFSHFFFAIAIASLATLAILSSSHDEKRRFAYVGISIWLAFSVLFLFWTPEKGTGIVAAPEVLADLFLMAIAGLVVALARPNVAFASLSALCILSSLYSAFTLSGAYNKPEQRAVEATPLDPVLPSIIGFVQAHGGGKALSKVVIAGPGIESYLNRNLPWLVGNQVKLMNFQGYPPHLSVLTSFAERFGTYGRFDYDWLKQGGLDFVFWNDSSTTSLDAIKAQGFKLGAVLDLPFGNHFAAVEQARLAPPLLDLSAGNPAWPAAYVLDGWAVDGTRLIKTPGAANHFGYPVDETVGTAYDIGFNIDAGSRGRLTVAFGNAVVEEIDVDGARRLEVRSVPIQPGDLWITASPDFVGSLSNIVVRPAEGPAPIYDNGILSVDAAPGVVTSFDTDYSSRVALSLDVAAPTRVTYLLWPTPYMAPYVDGRAVSWTDPEARPLSLEVPAGSHKVEMRFQSGAATAFRVTMGAFTLALLAAVAWVVAVRLGYIRDPAALIARTLSLGLGRRLPADAATRPTWRDVVGAPPEPEHPLSGLRGALLAQPAVTLALGLLLATLVLTLLVNFGVAELLTDNPWGLPYVGELPGLRGNDLSRLMAASDGFAPQVGADLVMPGEAVPYPPFAFLVFGVLAALPASLAWTLFYLPALLQIGIAAWFARLSGHWALGVAWFGAILLVYPFLYVLDRANVDLYTGILCFGALVALGFGRTRPAAAAIGLAAAFKIYPLVLLALFLRRDRPALLVGLGVAGAATVAGLVVLQQGPFEALAFLREHTSRTSSCFQDETRCLNLSFAVPFKIAFASLVTFDWYPALWEWAYRAYGLVSLALAAGAALFVALRPARLWIDALRLTLVMTLLPAMSYDYKLLLFLGPLALALAEMRDGRTDRPRAAAIVLMAVLLSSFKWLGQWPHLWIHAGAQMLLLGVAILAQRDASQSLRQRLEALRWRAVAATAVVAVALLAVWNTFGNGVTREIWGRSTSWCPVGLTYSEADPFPIWGEGWAAFESAGGDRWRWTTANVAELYLPLGGKTAISGVVALPPGAPDGTIEIRSETGSTTIAVAAGQAVPFAVDVGTEGLSRIEFVAPELRSVDGRDLGLVVSGLRATGECR